MLIAARQKGIRLPVRRISFDIDCTLVSISENLLS